MKNEKVDNSKLEAEFKRLVDSNGRDVAWVSEHFGQLCQFYLNQQNLRKE